MKDKKKKIILIVAIVAVIVIALILGLFVFKKNNGGKKEETINAMITLDINPSFEIEIQDGKANRINPLNEEAWELIDRKFEGEPLEDVLQEIVVNAREKGYMEDDHLSIILGMEKNDKRIEDMLRETCDKQHIPVEIIVPEITEEAKKEAEGYGVTPAKAAYILSILKENQELNFDDLKDKSVIELHEMKESGNWCDHDYTLHGNLCEKIVREEKPQEGKTCPEGYEDADGQCKKIGQFKDELYCENDLTLKDDKCSGEVAVAADPKCTNGTYNSNTGKCESLEYINAGTKACNNTGFDPADKMMSNGKCSRGKPVLPEGCPDAVEIDGWCYNSSGDYDPTVTCSSGTYRDGSNGKGCYNVTTVDAGYTCSQGTLKGNKCMVNKETKALTKHGCEEGYTLYQNKVCVSNTETKEYTVGLTCPEEARLVEERCVFYETVEAHSK